MPTRLTELVVQYPYVRGTSSTHDVFLPPRVSSRSFAALFVRVETEFSSSRDQVRCHPLQFLKDALAADVVVGKSELSTLWEKIRNASNESPGGLPGLGQVFADESIRYLALVPGDHPLKRVASSTLSTPKIPGPRRYVSSPGPSETVSHDRAPILAANGHRGPPLLLSTAAKSVMPTDWAQFSSAGFSNDSAPLPLASTLFGQDVEKTNPPLRKASRHSMISRSPSEIHKSADVAYHRRASNPSRSETPITFASRSYPLSVVEIDEAFIEFWVDALLDPIASMWRRFIICKLRSSVCELTVDEKPVEYVVVEQVSISKPAPQVPTIEVVHSQPVEMARAMSLDKSTVASSLGRLSIRSERSRFFGVFGSSPGRHSLYGSPIAFLNARGSNKRKMSSAHNVSDLGEVLEGSVHGKKTAELQKEATRKEALKRDRAIAGVDAAVTQDLPAKGRISGNTNQVTPDEGGTQGTSRATASPSAIRASETQQGMSVQDSQDSLYPVHGVEEPVKNPAASGEAIEHTERDHETVSSDSDGMSFFFFFSMEKSSLLSRL